MNITKVSSTCCGCGECYAVCPVKAIEMQKNREGFFYPVVDDSRCIQCGKCIEHCTFNKRYEGHSVLEAFALKHCDLDVRTASRSGGLFTAVSDLILELDGVVYGCELQKCREAVHIRATTKEQRNACRGSKYIQSKMFEMFDQIQMDLKNGRWVLFTGTACQVAAVADYCRNEDCTKLLLVDIVCHGVPSPTVWNDYLTFVSKRHRKEIAAVDFRDKQTYGWAAHKDTVTFIDGTKFSADIFTQLFYAHYILREACFDCPYRNTHRVGDITIADCWGITQHYPEFDDNKGVSLVLVNTVKGESIFRQLQRVESIPVDINKLLQAPLRENWPKPNNYNEFWEFYHNHSFKKVMKKYVNAKPHIIVRIVRKLKREAKGICRKLVC